MFNGKNITPLRTALIYLLFGALWIACSDVALTFFVPASSPNYAMMQTVKGWLFVFASASLIYLMLKRDIVALLQAKFHIAYQTELLASIVESNTDAIFGKTLDGIVISWNAGAEKIYGYTAKEMIGNSIMTIAPLEKPDDIPSILEKVRRGEHIEQYETIRITKAGKRIDVSLTVSPILNDERKVVGASVISHDITERKQAERIRERAEIKYRTLVEQLPIVAYINPADEPAYTNYVSPQIQTLLGYSQQEWLADPKFWTTLLHPQDRDRVLMLSRDLKTREGSVKIEYRMFARDGREIWVHDEVALVRDADGKPQFWQGFMIDITARKRAEEALEEQEAWLIESQRVGRIGSYVLDIEKGVWTSSNVLDELFGITQNDEKTIASWNALILPEQRDEMLRYFTEDVFEKHESFNKEYPIVRARDGQTRWVWGQGELAFGENGRPIKMFGTIQDVTERKRAQTDLFMSEQRYRLLFENMPVAIWEEDFSAAKKYLDSLKEQGVKDFRAYFSAHADVAMECSKGIRILNMNDSALKMYGAKSKEELIESTNEDMNNTTSGLLTETLIAIAYGMSSLRWEGPDATVAGAPIEISLSWSIVPGAEQDYSKIIVTTIDITERKQAEAALRENEFNLRALFETMAEGVALNEIVYDENGEMVDYRILNVNPAYYSSADFNENVPVIGNVATQVYGMSVESIRTFWKSHREGVDTDYTEYWSPLNNRCYFIATSPFLDNRFVTTFLDITERKQTEQRLEESRKFFQNALDALSAHIAILDENGVITAVNKNWRQFGVENGSTMAAGGIGMNYLEVCRSSEGEDSPQALSIAGAIQEMILDASFETQKTFEYPCHSPTEKRWFVARLTKFMEDGKTRVVVSHENITERKLTEQNIERRVVELEALYQSGISFAQTLDQKDIGEKVIEVLSGSLDWHHAAVRVRRPDSDEVELLASIHSSEHSDDDLRLQSAITRVGVGLSGWAIKHGKSVRINNLENDPRYINTFDGMKSGLYVPMRTYDKIIGCISAESDQLNAFTDEDERLLSTLATQAAVAIQNAELFAGIKSELARRREVEEKNLRQLERLTALQEINQAITSTLDLQVRLDTLISQAVQVLSVDAATVLFLNSEFNILEYKAGFGLRTEHPETARIVVDHSYAGRVVLQKQMVQIPDLVHEPENLLLDGFLRAEEFVSYYGVPLIAKGAVIGVMEIFNRSIVDRDTEWLDYFRTLAELAAIAIDNANLYSVSQHELAERRQAEKALLQSYRVLEQRVEERTADLHRLNLDLEQAVRIKDEFLASMSHELRTPLNAIIGLSESLAEKVAGPLTSKQEKYITTIGESGHHLLEMINDILDLAKIDSGHMELNINPIQVQSLCESSLRMIKELAQKKSLNLSFQMDPAVKIISGDERRLKQSLVNLLINAVKFTSNGGNIGLQVLGHPEERTATFEVWDNGIGIESSQIPLLFQPFVQLDAGLAREYAGTGLGLVLVRQMIQMHGGTVQVESEKGKGSRFAISLPWAPESNLDPVKETPRLSEASTEFEYRSGGIILLVEDTEEIIVLLSDYLSHKGYVVLAARNGAEGVAIALQEHPQLILMDVMMPVMDGLEATRRIRLDASLKNIPIVGLTSLAMPGDKEKCIEAGMSDYISKPVELKQLINLINKYLVTNKELGGV